MPRRTREETSAGGVVFRMDAGQPRYLVIRDGYRNWGFPKGHLNEGETAQDAAIREVGEETGLKHLVLHGVIETIDWRFRFRGRDIHKTCHFYLMESSHARTSPQRAEGITACRWATFADAQRLLSYRNARAVLRHAHATVCDAPPLGAEDEREAAV